MAITYTTNLGLSLIDAIEAAGYTFGNHDGVWVSSDDVAVQAIIDTHDPLPFERAAQLEIINAYYNGILDQVTQTYPPQEVTSWAKQEADADRGLYQELVKRIR